MTNSISTERSETSSQKSSQHLATNRASKLFGRFGDFESAQRLFAEMPDVSQHTFSALSQMLCDRSNRDCAFANGASMTSTVLVLFPHLDSRPSLSVGRKLCALGMQSFIFTARLAMCVCSTKRRRARFKLRTLQLISHTAMANALCAALRFSECMLLFDESKR